MTKGFKGTVDLLLKNGMTIEDLINKAKEAITAGINIDTNQEILVYLRDKKLKNLGI